MPLPSSLLSTTPAPPTLRDLPSPELVCPPLPASPCPMSWNFARPRKSDFAVADLASDSANAALNAGSEFVHESAAASHHLLEAANTVLKKALADLPSKLDWLRVGEEDVFKKLSIQRRFYEHWYVPDIPKHVPPTDEFTAIAKILAQKVRAKAGPLLNVGPLEAAIMTPLPVDTMGGWPAFSTDYTSFLDTVTALGYARGHEDSRRLAPRRLIDAGLALANHLGLPAHPFPAGIARRSGPTQKATKLFSFSGGAAYATQEASGLFTRPRHVFPGSRPHSFAEAPLYVALNAYRRATPGLWHDQPALAWQQRYIEEKLSAGWHVGEGDYSGYDQHLSAAHRCVIYEACEAAGVAPDSARYCRDMEELMVLLIPHLGSPAPGSMSILTLPHGLLSGELLTSVMGTMNNVIIKTKYNLRKYGKTLEWWKTHDFHPTLMLSDDTLPIEPLPIDEELYHTVCREEGHELKLNAGRRMLMVHQDGRATYSVACRIVQQTLWNEDRITHLGQAVLGLASRLSRPPHPALAPAVHEVLSLMTGQLGGIYRDVTSGVPRGSAPEWKSVTRTLLLRDEVSKFLLSAVGRAYATNLFTSLSYKPSGLEMAQLLREMGVTPDTSAIQLHETAARRMFSPASPSERSAALNRLTSTIWH